MSEVAILGVLFQSCVYIMEPVKVFLKSILLNSKVSMFHCNNIGNYLVMMCSLLFTISNTLSFLFFFQDFRTYYLVFLKETLVRTR